MPPHTIPQGLGWHGGRNNNKKEMSATSGLRGTAARAWPPRRGSTNVACQVIHVVREPRGEVHDVARDEMNSTMAHCPRQPQLGWATLPQLLVEGAQRSSQARPTTIFDVATATRSIRAASQERLARATSLPTMLGCVAMPGACTRLVGARRDWQGCVLR